MKLGYHGGKCCGIKTIHGLGERPTDTLKAREKTEFKGVDAMGHDVNSLTSFFTDAAPVETYKDRFVRFIDFCKVRRPQGMIEVTLATAPLARYDQTKIWGPILLEHGFKEVAKAENSNSGNFVHVYYLCYGS